MLSSCLRQLDFATRQVIFHSHFSLPNGSRWVSCQLIEKNSANPLTGVFTVNTKLLVINIPACFAGLWKLANISHLLLNLDSSSGIMFCWKDLKHRNRYYITGVTLTIYKNTEGMQTFSLWRWSNRSKTLRLIILTAFYLKFYILLLSAKCILRDNIMSSDLTKRKLIQWSLLGVWTVSDVLQITHAPLLIQAVLQTVHLLQDENQGNPGPLPGLVTLSRLHIAVNLGQC